MQKIAACCASPATVNWADEKLMRTVLYSPRNKRKNPNMQQPSPQPPAPLPAFIRRLEQSDSFAAMRRVVAQTELASIDFSPYYFFDEGGYTRSLLHVGDAFEMILICWARGQKSELHDHADSQCMMCCLEGALLERRYRRERHNGGAAQLRECDEGTLTPHQWSAINNDIGLHEIVNVHAGRSVSLHLYIPEIASCTIYDRDCCAVRQTDSVFHRHWRIDDSGGGARIK